MIFKEQPQLTLTMILIELMNKTSTYLKGKMEYLPEEVEQNLGFVISDVHRLITTAVDSELKALGLTRSQLRIILHLIRKDGISQVAIADDLQLGKVTVGGLLDRLQEKGLINRREHPTDRRSKLVDLTIKDKHMYESILKAGGVITSQLLQGISRSEQRELIALLLRVKENSLIIINN